MNISAISGMNGMSGNYGMNNYAMGYGGNYIDMLFNNILQNGLRDISVLTIIINSYLYLSLDKIKELLKWLNDHLATKFKFFLENQKDWLFSNFKNYLWSSVNMVLSLFKSKPISSTSATDVEIPNMNSFIVMIDMSNKVDMMSLGNFFLKNKFNTWSTNTVIRQETDKYKSQICYNLPERFMYEVEGINLTVEQGIDFTLVCEIDQHHEVLKNIRIKSNDSDIEEITESEFRMIYRAWSASFRYSFKTNAYNPESLRGWSSDPSSITNGRYNYLLYTLYLTKNFNIIKKFFLFLLKKQPFSFLGRKFRLQDTSCDLTDRLGDPSALDKFTAELGPYCDHLITQNDNSTTKEYLIKCVDVFKEVSKSENRLRLTFASNDQEIEQLANFSSKFMLEIITDYYTNSLSSLDNKVSVCKLKIDWKITLQEKENPYYVEWCEQYGEADKSNAEKESESDSESDSEFPKLKKTDKKQTDAKTTKKTFEWKPRAPPKTFKLEVKSPIVKAERIKSSQKPFQYLYLEVPEKKLLLSYLTNFKENKSLYDKMGIPYKGGILLSGVPGCGKSTTILAVATFLNKNIFFVDLGQIHTNDQLKLCVDYVKETSQNGGIIIFEDIDCMTDIVLRRNRNVSVTNNKPVPSSDSEDYDDSDKLSLSYLLNILDGTMAPEDIIFIMTTNHQDKLDPALIRPGRMDISIKLKRCSRYQLKCIFKDIFSREISETVLNKFKENTFSTADVILNLFHNIYNKDLNDAQLLHKFIDISNPSSDSEPDVELSLNSDSDSNLGSGSDSDSNLGSGSDSDSNLGSGSGSGSGSNCQPDLSSSSSSEDNF